ncbi:hypothetical protein ACC730_37600, partial [Rhizobium ruizarguesonis]
VIVLLLTLGTFATSLWAFQFIPQNFFPQSSRPEILVDLWLPEGTSIKEVDMGRFLQLALDLVDDLIFHFLNGSTWTDRLNDHDAEGELG